MRITYHRWSYTLAAGLLLAGCKSDKDMEPAPKAQATAPAPKPAALAPTPTLAPVSDATLSYLENSPNKKCRWMQLTPPGEPRTVATLPIGCGGLRLAWRPDGRQALAFYGHWSKHKIWQVDLATGTSTAFSSLPSRGTLGTLGFDKQGRPVALMEERYYEEGADTPSSLKMVETGTGEDKKEQLLFEGKRYDLDLDPDGEPGLAHAFRLENDGTWTRFETKSASYDVPYSSGYDVLGAIHALAPTSARPPGSVQKALEDVPEDSPDFAALSAVREPSDIGGWKQLKTAAGPLYLYLWNDPSQDPPQHTGLVRIRGEEGLVEPEGLSFSDELRVSMRGALVLLESRDDSGKRVARLWNAKTKKLVASLNDKQVVTFWPKPTSTPAAVVSPTSP
ncbi:hypothetical protein [Archangium sp.]|uniref:hypothetical protein n=1 Tax=Archangium sp. TaxID=1872627 RepID=UPI002D72C777|nr:hypothetical protein [Archangium sp.]HYO59284.1 hypothetical protein [Archangium sp.]